MCASRQACPEVKDFLHKLGFTQVDEVFDDPTADLTAEIEVQSNEQMKNLFERISQSNEKITQISVTI